MAWRWLSAVPRKLLRIDPCEVLFSRRGFPESSPLRPRLEQVGATFLQGYHAALEEPAPVPLAERLQQMDRELWGFAYEGAAMGLALQDGLFPWGGGRWNRFLASSGEAHCYLLYVGYGWAVARLPWQRAGLERRLARLDPLLRWLVLDGFGFHEGYFHGQRELQNPARGRRWDGYARRAFDQGLGRSVWFAAGGDLSRVVAILDRIPIQRKPDLWSGVGLACAYAGALSDDSLRQLLDRAGDCRGELALGAAFAAKARQRAGNMAPHTERACEFLCGCDVQAAARITDEALNNLPPDRPDQPAFEAWRTRIRQTFDQGATRYAACP
ncbi:MAG: DUF1702 family protein [Planctomycetales bacterium]